VTPTRPKDDRRRNQRASQCAASDLINAGDRLETGLPERALDVERRLRGN
jgi:hypothetical protein